MCEGPGHVIKYFIYGNLIAGIKQSLSCAAGKLEQKRKRIEAIARGKKCRSRRNLLVFNRQKFMLATLKRRSEREESL